MEVRFVEFFIGKGVSWKVLREAASYAAREIGSGHPFSTAKFKTDGKRIFADFMMERRRSLLDIVAQQYTLPTVIDSYLYEGVVFHGGDPARWFPFRNSKKIVIDPAISFGQPTLHPEAVPTSVLAKAFAVEKSIERVSKWYSVPSSSVRTAVEYEQQLAA
jgi:uncharacterized protein (DUF433 family)